MNIILEGIDERVQPRTHPYDGAEYDRRVKHYDLVNHPELIRTSLEDFKPWETYQAIDWFYQLLEWLNGPTSIFETSDCRLEAPKPNTFTNIPCDLVLCGRLMIFFRDISLNYADIVSDTRYFVNSRVSRLGTGAADYLKTIYQDIWWNTIQIFFFPTNFLQPDNKDAVFGHQVVFQFNCFNNEENGTFEAFMFVIDGLIGALKLANEDFKKELINSSFS